MEAKRTERLENLELTPKPTFPTEKEGRRMSTETKQATCEDRVENQLAGRISDLRQLRDAHCGVAVECEDCEGTGFTDTGTPGTGVLEGATIYSDFTECPKCEGSGEIKPDDEGNVEDLGNIYEYGLCFDYVAPETFGEDQDQGYFRYQLSCGGPSDEFRFYTGPEFRAHTVEYVFLDWFDGATRTLGCDNKKLLTEIFDWFEECGSATNAYEEAMN